MHFIHLADKSSGCEKYEITFHVSIALQIKKQMGKGSIQFKVQNPHPVAVVVFRHLMLSTSNNSNCVSQED